MGTDRHGDLEKILHYRFREPRLLHQALVHRSYVHENPHLQETDNETLEFLGDSVLGLSVSHLLWELYPRCNEGDLSRLRSAIVNERELARLALRSRLGDHVLLGKGEEMTGGRRKPSVLADTMEAVLAAVYLDGGLEAAIQAVRRLFRDYLSHSFEDHPLKTLDKDYKTQLQELTQGRLKLTPTYFLEATCGPDHDKTFHMSVMLEESVLARGSGRSKKEAQQEAARKALEKLAPDDEFPRQACE